MLLSVPLTDEFAGSRMRELEGLRTVPRLSTTGACASSAHAVGRRSKMAATPAKNR